MLGREQSEGDWGVLDVNKLFVGAQKVHSHPKSYPHFLWIDRVSDWGCC
jgi:hypothetical protein